MSEAWRGFCRPGTRLFEVYECRGTRVVASRSQVRVQRVLKEALVRLSRFSVVKAGVAVFGCWSPFKSRS
jgi:hypothetical protein